jgi:uncharacterized protein with ParB-like and HNH nuclease domain
MQKSIGDLLKKEEYNFFIPYYQRGYRWGEVQIYALLNDLLEFYRKIKADIPNYKYYSLQPLVVKKDNDVYRVIDGQQRLTTIFLILSAFENFAQTRNKAKFSLAYEREGSAEFLEKINDDDFREKEQKNNIDFLYMSKAYESILRWVKTNKYDEDYIEEFMNFIRRGSDLTDEGHDINKNIRFIWYELDEDADEFDTFIRLNIGKIPLTNAELIKSFIIQNVQVEEKRFEISKEWDDIEYALNNNEFFGFLTKEKIDTRIELLFRILLDKKSYKEFALYENFTDKYEKVKIEDIWKEIKRIHYILLYWFENREIYHLVGYLIAIDKNIIDIWGKYREHDGKGSFQKSLALTIKNELKIEIDNEKVFLKTKKEILPFSNLYYKHPDTKKLLLLCNVLTLLTSSRESYIKFSFDLFNGEKWSIEHINPQTDKLDEAIKKKDYIKQLKELNNIELNKILETLSTDDNDKKKKAMDTLEEFFSDKDIRNDNDDIRNLTLLSSVINSSLQNNFFPIKRKMLIKKDQSGGFIPIVTKNLFLKYYNDFIDEDCNMMKWTNSDGERYVNEMEKLIIKFFEGEN